jgi:predicted DNA-binding transcriptional regulator YafY
MSTTDYTNDAQQRILKLLMLLAGHELLGLAPARIALEQACSPSQVTRDLQNLKTAGMAELVQDTGGWRLAPTVVQIAVRHAVAMERAKAKLNETAMRYARDTSARTYTPGYLEDCSGSGAVLNSIFNPNHATDLKAKHGTP